MPLSGAAMHAYLNELRDTVDAALFRFGELQVAAECWVRLQSRIDPDDGMDHESWYESLSRQTHIFDALEAFLAAWARVSLLLFPSAEKGGGPVGEIRRARGHALQKRLALQERLEPDQPSVLKDLDLRNAWMHFDDRLDWAVANKTLGNRLLFVMQSEVTPELQKVTLRLIEVDTLHVHFRAENGARKETNLFSLRDALENVRERLRVHG